MDFVQANNNRNRTWTANNGSSHSNNGFLMDRHQGRPATPGNLSQISTVSGRTAAQRTASGNGFGPAAGDASAASLSSRSTVLTAAKRTAAAVPYNPHLISVQSKFRRKYRTRVLLFTFVLLVIILFITIIVICITHKSKSADVCRSKECLRTAASLVYSMDDETDPCEDFYRFTCGNWAAEHPRPDAVTSNDWFRERQAKVLRQLREFLRANISDSEPAAVGKAKTMYRACMDTVLLDKRDLEPLLHYLRAFKLPLLPRALNYTLSSESTKRHGTDAPEEFNWVQTLVLIKRYLGMDLIIGFDIFPDPLNRTLNRIALGTPETESSLPFNNDELHQLLRKARNKMLVKTDNDDDHDVDDKESDEEESAKQHSSSSLAVYTTYVRKIIEMYLFYLDPDTNPEDAEAGAAEMAAHAIKFSRTIFNIKEEAENATKSTKNPIEDLVYISVADLQNQTDKEIAPKTMPLWAEYLRLMMDGANHSKPLRIADLKVITSQADIMYLQDIVFYLQDLSPATIEAYIWLSVVEELVLHTTSDMRLLHAEYMRLVINTEGSTPRSLYCAHGVNSLMGMAVSYTLADDGFTRFKLPRVRKMLHNIRSSFDNLVRSTSWMDAATKRETLKKSAEMKSFIGYPDWLRNATELNAHYEGVRVNKSLHLENMVGVLRWSMQSRLDNLFRAEPSSWATAPSNVNAFHTFQSNAITIPIAILQYPFYDLGMEALNYGSIGAILGHELTHGFDDSGRMFDKDGNMVQWWSNDTVNEYVNRTECFVDQYNHYYLDDIGEYIDGKLTLGENIADNGGMREAFYAYRLYVRTAGKERLKLPGLEQYTHEQLFFISFGNLWCETYTPAASHYALEDTHCPGKMRLRGVLSNSEEFASTFNCRRGSGMNPKGRKCRIW